MDGVHSRRARPTLRLLREDLTSGWGAVHPQRSLAAGRLGDLHPLSELPHPIITKATECFGANPDEDNFVGPIGCSTRLRLLEIKQSQWRGGIWDDPATGVRWLVVAGLAKGGHQDRDDFYKHVEREDRAGSTEQWLPHAEDIRLLKQETAARLRTQWELETQKLLLETLRLIGAGGSRRISIDHPVPNQGKFAVVDLTVAPVRDEGYEADEMVVEIIPESRYAGSNLLWEMTTRILISLEPPEQGWDRDRDTYINIGEPGAWSNRARDLETLESTGELAVSEPGSISHYTHRAHLAGKTINGEAVRALCGPFFVPRQDHESLPLCPTCEQRLQEIAPSQSRRAN